MAIPPGVKAALAAQAVIFGALLTIGLDQYAHMRVERMGGVNVWGYRGPVARQKIPNEIRIVVVGGDQAFGWGVAAAETMNAYLRRLVEVGVNVAGREPASVTTVNLGALGLPAHGYAPRLQQFTAINPDVIVLAVDLADSGPFSIMPPGDSAVATLTGYHLMLPIVLDERGRLMQGGLRLPGAAVSALGRSLRALDAGAYRVFAGADSMTEDRMTAIGRAVHVARGSAANVMIVLPVPRDEIELAERDRLRVVIGAGVAQDPRLAMVDLSQSPALLDPALLLDEHHYGANGHSLAALAIAPEVVRLLRMRGAS